mmetsp:Transcript_76067/g.126790  ORF Transcript_76067/g.126790 Transcript_76067/m.126790 type:complete len:225 (-) Transcript_76067:138-812(-)
MRSLARHAHHLLQPRDDPIRPHGLLIPKALHALLPIQRFAQRAKRLLELDAIPDRSRHQPTSWVRLVQCVGALAALREELITIIINDILCHLDCSAHVDAHVFSEMILIVHFSHLCHFLFSLFLALLRLLATQLKRQVSQTRGFLVTGWAEAALGIFNALPHHKKLRDGHQFDSPCTLVVQPNQQTPLIVHRKFRPIRFPCELHGICLSMYLELVLLTFFSVLQ